MREKGFQNNVYEKKPNYENKCDRHAYNIGEDKRSVSAGRFSVSAVILCDILRRMWYNQFLIMVYQSEKDFWKKE